MQWRHGYEGGLKVLNFNMKIAILAFATPVLRLSMLFMILLKISAILDLIIVGQSFIMSADVKVFVQMEKITYRIK